MARNFFSEKSNYIPFLIITLSVLIKLFLSWRSEFTLATPEIEKYYFAKSLPLLISEKDPQLLEYAKINGHFLFFTPLLFLFPFAQFLEPNVHILKIPNLILGSFLSFLLYQVLIKFIGEKNQGRFIAAIIIALSPWITAITFYNLLESLSLSFILAAVLIFLKTREKKSTSSKTFIILILLLLSAFSSWAGYFFIASLIFISPFYLLKNNTFSKSFKNFPHILLGACAIFIGITIFNKSFIITSLSKNTFIEKLRPSVLASEINERQKVDFLSMNKNFILPPLVRKVIYNKPTLAFNKVLIHAGDIIDFEHWAFPFESYDQLKASGILPKGNLPFVYFFEIPLIIFGFYILIRKGKIKPLLPFLIAAFIPYLVFEKRDLIFSGVFFLPLVLATEIISINFLSNKFNVLNRSTTALAATLLVLITTPSIINFYVLLFFDQERYKRSDQFLYRDIAALVSENKLKFKKIIITDRFGPTHLSSALYLNIPPEVFWPSVLSSQKEETKDVITLQNMEFRPIEWKKEVKDPNSLYIGLLGEYIGPSENPEQKGVPKDITVLKEISFTDELVWQYGRKLLIASPQ